MWSEVASREATRYHPNNYEWSLGKDSVMHTAIFSASRNCTCTIWPKRLVPKLKLTIGSLVVLAVTANKRRHDAFSK